MRSYILSNNKYDINGNVIPNKFISPLGNEVTLYFPSPLHLDNNKSYEVSIRRASIVYTAHIFLKLFISLFLNITKTLQHLLMFVGT